MIVELDTDRRRAAIDDGVDTSWGVTEQCSARRR